MAHSSFMIKLSYTAKTIAGFTVAAAIIYGGIYALNTWSDSVIVIGLVLFFIGIPTLLVMLRVPKELRWLYKVWASPEPRYTIMKINQSRDRNG